MRCKWSAADAERMASDLMPSQEAAEYGRHLAACERCTADVSRGAQLRQVLHEAFHPVAVPAGAKTRLVTRLRGNDPLSQPVRKTDLMGGTALGASSARAPGRRRAQRWLTLTAAAGLVALIAVIGVGLWQLGAWDHGTGVLPSAPRPSVVPIAPSRFSWEALRQRPLSLPALTAGAVCPVTVGPESATSIHPVLDGGKAPQFGFGRGPVYLSGIVFFYPLGVNNTVWLSAPDYTGPILVRGSPLDGPSSVGFSAFSADWAAGELLRTVDLHSTNRAGQDVVAVPAVKVYSELDLPAADGPRAPGASWRMWLTRTHIEVPGCYALRVDGLDFSELFVFEAPNGPPPGG